MAYLIEVEDAIKDYKMSYKKGLELADKVQAYLKENGAILVTGASPGLSSEAIRIWSGAGDWVYHLKDTTLFSEIRPYGLIEVYMTVQFATAGRKAKEILSDLQSILDEYK